MELDALRRELSSSIHLDLLLYRDFYDNSLDNAIDNALDNREKSHCNIDLLAQTQELKFCHFYNID